MKFTQIVFVCTVVVLFSLIVYGVEEESQNCFCKDGKLYCKVTYERQIHSLKIELILNEDSSISYSAYTVVKYDLPKNKSVLPVGEFRVQLPKRSTFSDIPKVKDHLTDKEFQYLTEPNYAGEYTFDRETNMLKINAILSDEMHIGIEGLILPKNDYSTSFKYRRYPSNNITILLPESPTPYHYAITVKGGENVRSGRLGNAPCNISEIDKRPDTCTLYYVSNGFLVRGHSNGSKIVEMEIGLSGENIILESEEKEAEEKRWSERMREIEIDIARYSFGLAILLVFITAYYAMQTRKGVKLQENLWEKDGKKENAERIYAPLYSELEKIEYLVKDMKPLSYYSGVIKERKKHGNLEDQIKRWLENKVNPVVILPIIPPIPKWDYIRLQHLDVWIPEKLKKELTEFYNDEEMFKNYHKAIGDSKSDEAKESQKEVLDRIHKLKKDIEKEMQIW